MFNISIVIPSINPNKWPSLYEQLIKSVGKYNFEMICVGPNHPPINFNYLNFRYIREFSCPSRSFQIGTEMACGEMVAFIPDDIILDSNGLQDSISSLKSLEHNCGVILRYDEGGHNQSQNYEYWRGKYHADQNLAGIHEDWKIAPCFMYYRNYFIDIGGLDCRLEHVNLNSHSVAYLTQYKGGQLIYSPSRIFQASWQPATDATVLYQAYLQNDLPLFQKTWREKDSAEKYKVNFNNWRNVSPYWKRKYTV